MGRASPGDDSRPAGSRLVKELEHYGVKGMHWGVRKDRDTSPVAVEVIQKRPGTRVSAKGGRNLPASEDARQAAAARRVARSSTLDALSTKELQALVKRMQLEQQYSQIISTRADTPVKKGRKFVKDLLGLGKTANEVVAFNNSPAGKKMRAGFAAASAYSRKKPAPPKGPYKVYHQPKNVGGTVILRPKAIGR